MSSLSPAHDTTVPVSHLPHSAPRTHSQGAHRILSGVFILRGNSCLKRGIGGPGGFWCCWSFLVPVEGAEIPSRDRVMSQAEELPVINPFSYMHGHEMGSLCQDKHPEYWKTTCLKPCKKLIQKKSLIFIRLEVFKEKLPDSLWGFVFFRSTKCSFPLNIQLQCPKFQPWAIDWN